VTKVYRPQSGEIYAYGSEADDRVGNNARRFVGVPDRMGPTDAYDTPVIEMIAKPAHPCEGFGGTG
jgi:hypothetical protein